MSHRGPLTAVITTVLGATLGGLLIWHVYRTKGKRLPSTQKVADPVEAPCPVEKEFTAVEHQYTQPSHLLEKEVKVVECQTAQLPPSVQIPSSEQLLGVKPVMVSSEEEWQQLWPLMQKELSVFPVLGLDCEWVKTKGVSAKGRTSAVSLLQMATYSGLCVLVRLLAFRSSQQPFPLSLMEVLRDPHILKVGVSCYEDGKRLTRDYGLSLTCTVDLRYLALRQRLATVNNGLSLKSLAADLLNISLDKSLELRCSDWEADQLTLEQMTYAARDAQVSIALFLHVLGLRSEANSASSGSSYSELAARCQGLVDMPFRGRGEGDDRASDGERRRRMRKPPSYESPESGDQQVPDPRKNNKRKPLGVGYSARKSPLYDNCFLHAPDGQPLCTCDKKKAKWYLDKGIGVLQSEDPFVVRLLFEPSGRPDSQQDYYLTAKENLCVVCGKADSYIRKNIVPHEYRRHFPSEMKDHNSHDILLLCTSCHAASNVHDSFLKQQLAEDFVAPQGCEDGVRLLEDSDRRRVRSAARALLTAGEGLPEQRREELQALIKSFLNMNEEQELTDEALQQAAGLETRIFNEAYVPHGLKVVRAHAEQGLQGLMDLERRWRQHFLTTMQPSHLPPLWSVDHNHSKFLRKYGDDLPIKLN
ncbi:exonuclease 3'-5' domain-containing protein 2 isoform X1 [Micropterus salmoides]|uniref:exonuclease 3'-5' domain-containing protein 2 isoform X1 n=1 Tax=Micropterus salmoides TaxID=27706 RepID=UPI0018ED92EE|nr:exonuclease 3'-5' domain-containing protein 2 isoform X1 [Micropterus salmoides]XP_038584557.1 exonuclease 3'-5' domain-containing protein 2 isoform X1 [Micropterus salmoides]XP_038584558.1 exonuclease 3'-5' domain-containing protein 2 isoform X1 [Micropterus salmoides]